MKLVGPDKLDRVWEAVYAVAFVGSFERTRRQGHESLSYAAAQDHDAYAQFVADCAVEQLRESGDGR